MKIPIPKTLTPEQIDSFIEIFKQTYDFELTREEAVIEGMNLIRLIAFALESDTDGD